MEVKWMEEIAAHLGRIAGAHERVAGALEQIAKSAEIGSVDKLLEGFSDVRCHRELGESLRKKFRELAYEYAAHKTEGPQ